MNIKFIVILSVAALASCAEWSDQECRDCDYPCDCDDEVPVRSARVVNSHVKERIATDRTVLVCSPGSYFTRIEFDGCYKINSTCNGIFAGIESEVRGTYVGYKNHYRYEDDDNYDDNEEHERKIDLNARDYYYYYSWLNGWLSWYENTEIHSSDDSDECEFDRLVAYSSWAPDDRIDGCCHKGVRHWESTYYKLNIYGKCCSECYLVSAAITIPEPVKNSP